MFEMNYETFTIGCPLYTRCANGKQYRAPVQHTTDKNKWNDRINRGKRKRKRESVFVCERVRESVRKKQVSGRQRERNFKILECVRADYLMECQDADISIPYYKQTNNQLQ